MRTLLKRSELLWLDGVGHMPNLGAEAEFNRGLVRLLYRVEAVGATVPAI